MRTDHAAGPASSGGYLRAPGEPPGYDTASIIPRLRLTIPGPCIGGPIMGAAGQPVGHGSYRFDCSGGGSAVVHLGN
jgi:hypothetical protein